MRSIYYHLPISDHVYSVIKQQILGASVKYRMNNVALCFSPPSCCCCSSGVDVCGPWDQHAQHVRGCRTPSSAYLFIFLIFLLIKSEFMNLDESLFLRRLHNSSAQGGAISLPPSFFTAAPQNKPFFCLPCFLSSHMNGHFKGHSNVP